MVRTDVSESAASDAARSSRAAGQARGRYDFEVPAGIQVTDLLAIQLADCVRIVQTISDQATAAHLDDLERMRMVNTIESVVNASARLTQMIDRLQGGAPCEDDSGSAQKKRKT